MRFYILVAVALSLGFDHAGHDARAPVACDGCHRIDARGEVRGRPGHAACFGACHGAAPARPRAPRRGKRRPYAIAAAQAAVCAACHPADALAALAAGTSAAAPVVAGAPDLGARASHAAHAAAGATCRDCHDADGGAARPRHARCASCHRATARPGFDDCAACHVAGTSPRLAPGPLAPTGWSHADHRKAAPAADCLGCHAPVAATASAALPAPTTADCAGCHDGHAAFATTARCTACHRDAPTATVELTRPSARFSHVGHRDRVGSCASCHGLDRRGEATAPAHASCADAACHGGDFASTQPRICGACHVAIEPWRPLLADAPPTATTEFGSSMPHRTHAPLGLACAGCHREADAERERRPPQGHGACTGAACHAAGRATPAPPLDACEDCHREGLVAARVQTRLAARWSVRARFRHAAHDGACETCHAAVANVDGAAPTPAKDACAACHDGKAAFKMTGHGCARCHGKAE